MDALRALVLMDFFFFFDNIQCFIGKTKSKEDNLPYKHPTSQGADYQAKTQKLTWKTKKI